MTVSNDCLPHVSFLVRSELISFLRSTDPEISPIRTKTFLVGWIDTYRVSGRTAHVPKRVTNPQELASVQRACDFCPAVDRASTLGDSGSSIAKNADCERVSRGPRHYPDRGTSNGDDLEHVDDHIYGRQLRS